VAKILKSSLRPSSCSLKPVIYLPNTILIHCPVNGKRFGKRHIEPDWLLIYEVTSKEVMLFRTGTHSDLFDLIALSRSTCALK